MCYTCVNKSIKGGKTLYEPFYRSAGFKTPLYQVMASGLTQSTGHYYSCASFRKDPSKLRDHPECSFVSPGPSFGMIEMDWEQRVMKLQVRDGKGVAKLESKIDLATCLKIK